MPVYAQDPNPLLKISERDFDLDYKPQKSPSDQEMWTYQEVRAAGIPTPRVWTIVETGDEEDGNWYALPGFHIVNKIDYVVTEKPWPHENIEAVWFEDDFEKDEVDDPGVKLLREIFEKPAKED